MEPKHFKSKELGPFNRLCRARSRRSGTCGSSSGAPTSERPRYRTVQSAEGAVQEPIVELNQDVFCHLGQKYADVSIIND